MKPSRRRREGLGRHQAMRLATASHELGSPLHSHSISWLAATCQAQEEHIARLLRPPRAAPQKNAINLASCKTLAKARGASCSSLSPSHRHLCKQVADDDAPAHHCTAASRDVATTDKKTQGRRPGRPRRERPGDGARGRWFTCTRRREGRCVISGEGAIVKRCQRGSVARERVKCSTNGSTRHRRCY